MISIQQSELSTATAAAVLRPVSAEWDAVTPAGRRLEVAAGPEVETQCRRMGELPVGSAVITTGGALAAQFIVHVVIRSTDDAVTAVIVRRALQNGLRRVAEWGIESLALAPLGTGPGNLDPEDSARVMLPVLIEHMRTCAHPNRVDVLVESGYDQEVFERELRSLASAAETGNRDRASG